ncbi:hypothetical protein M8J76_006619 [Diaphorina citri]|nr:hypothetical protein M8J76_006619 [Diaphorina citri]
MKLIKKCDVELINYFTYQNELVILHPLIDEMVLESKTATVSSHPSSPHDYGSLEEHEVLTGDSDPVRSKSPRQLNHVVELPSTVPRETLASTPSTGLNSVGSKAVGTMTSTQGLNDLYQRTPLLSTNGGADWNEPNSNGGPKIMFTSQEDKKRGPGAVNSNGGIVRIDIGAGAEDNPKFPEENILRIAFLILVFNLVLTTTSLAIVHEWVPDRQVYKPLPDIVLDAVPATDWTLYLSEVLIMISTNIMVVVILVHRHRFIILRRLFLLLALLYMLRSITMFVTVLPVSSTSYNCAAKANSTSPRLIASRVLQLISGFGLSINGKHTFCGDYIYSGHTTILAMSYLMIYEYSPKRYFLLHWASFVMSVAGVIMVLVAHGHYTVDVLIAYYITTRLFWQRTPYNYLANVWWFRIFQYFEGNVGGPLPRQYETPLQIVRKYTYRHENRDS